MYETSYPKPRRGLAIYVLYTKSQCHLLFKKVYTVFPEGEWRNKCVGRPRLLADPLTKAYPTKAKAAPIKLKITGVNLIKGDKNSALIVFSAFAGNVNMALPKNGVPKPIKASLNQYPTNILPIANITSGADILIGDSCAPDKGF